MTVSTRTASALGRLRWRGPSRMLRTRRDRLVFGTAAVVVAAALIAGGVLLYRAANQGKRISALFSETIGVYPGSTVRILGVPVGTVDAVHPQGRLVRVTMTLDSGVKVPAGARAVVLAPSVVADRYVQLVPAYTGGPQIGNDAVIPPSRTAVPVEVDQVYAAITKLSTALGPNGANKHGALTDLIKTGAANLSGQGTLLRNMLTQYGGASRTLGNSATNLFSTLASLQSFTTMLKHNNGQVKLAEQQLAQVSAFLAGDRNDLAAAITQLSAALGQVQSFIGSNRALIKDNVAKLAAVTSALSAERASLAEALDTVPLAADNLLNAYDATTRTLNGRGDLNEFCLGPGARSLGCPSQTSTAAFMAGATAGSPAGAVPVPATALAALPPLPLPPTGTIYGTPQALLARSHR